MQEGVAERMIKTYMLEETQKGVPLFSHGKRDKSEYERANGFLEERKDDECS